MVVDGGADADNDRDADALDATEVDRDALTDLDAVTDDDADEDAGSE